MACNKQQPGPLTPGRQELVAKNRALALYIAERHMQAWPWLRAYRDDLRAEALCGLVEGATRWRPEDGDFIKSAAWGIRKRVLLFGRRGGRVVGLPFRGTFMVGNESSLDGPGEEEADDSDAATWGGPHLAGPGLCFSAECFDGMRLMQQAEEALCAHSASLRRGRTTPAKAEQDRRDARLFLQHVAHGETLESLGAANGLTKQAVQCAVERIRPAFDAWAADIRQEAA